jgi:hypothetical protein
MDGSHCPTAWLKKRRQNSGKYGPLPDVIEK